MRPSIGHFRVAIDHAHIARMRYWDDFERGPVSPPLTPTSPHLPPQ
jgi:hypothetical protein